MANVELLVNPEYHISHKDRDPSRLFASFGIFKTFNSSNQVGYNERPPYPILNGKPTIRDILSNINKSDICLYFATVGLGI